MHEHDKVRFFMGEKLSTSKTQQSEKVFRVKFGHCLQENREMGERQKQLG